MGNAIVTRVPPQLVNAKIPTLQRAWPSYEHHIKPPLLQALLNSETGRSHVANQSKPCCKTCQQVKAMLHFVCRMFSPRLRTIGVALEFHANASGAECKPGQRASQTVANRQERTDNRQPIGFLSLMQPHIFISGNSAEQTLERILWEMLMMGIPVSFHLHLSCSWLVVHILAEEMHTSGMVCCSVQYVGMPEGVNHGGRG